MTGGETAMPLTAVIITHERPEFFASAYRSLVAARALYPGEVEVLVVNSSRAPVLAQAEEAVREVHVPGAVAVVVKREIALRNARHAWLVCMDDDCTMPLDTFQVVAAEIARAPAGVAAFFCITEFVGPKSFWFRCLEDTDFLADFTWARDHEDMLWGPTSVAVLSRQFLLDVGGFDTTLGKLPAGGEDVEICLRLRRAGGRLRGIPKTLAYHTTATWNTLAGNLRRAFNYGRGEAELCRRYPDLTRLDRESPLFLGVPFLIVAAALLALKPRAATLALLPMLYLGSMVLGDFVRESVNFRKRAAATAGLVLYRWAYRLGRMRSSGSLPGLFRHFNWNGLAGEPPASRLDRSLLIGWISACGGAALGLLAGLA